MKTLSLNVSNLCVPCRCVCRHCLLSAKGQTSGVPYERGQAFAEKLWLWVREKRPELHYSFYVGFCNDFPQLPQYIQCIRKITPQLDVLQFNGLALRDEAETEILLNTVKENGMKGIDLTFYGVGKAHDRFSGRNGDFAFLLLLIKVANRILLDVNVSIAVTQDNMGQMEDLLAILSHYRINHYFAFLPHDKGRGESLSRVRLTASDFDRLPERMQKYFGTIPRRTEAEWLNREQLPVAQGRHLTLVLTRDNIDRLESMDPDDLIRELEAMDDAYYESIPSVSELARRYGNAENQQIYRFRDLCLQWQKRFLRENPSRIADMNDETHSFSIRIYNERS